MRCRVRVRVIPRGLHDRSGNVADWYGAVRLVNLALMTGEPCACQDLVNRVLVLGVCGVLHPDGHENDHSRGLSSPYTSQPTRHRLLVVVVVVVEGVLWFFSAGVLCAPHVQRGQGQLL